MKKLIVSFILLFTLLPWIGNAQDKIITTSGKQLACNITRITEDSLFFKIQTNDNSSETYITMDMVKEYSLENIEKLKNEQDSSSFFSIILKDGSGLIGKIISISQSKIEFNDNNLGVILIRGETIKSYKKENKDALYHITLNDGNELHGEILERTNNTIIFQTKNLGKVTIENRNIKKIQEVKAGEIVNGKYWFPNPNNTRYLFSPTAINLKKGEGYYQNAYVVANSANYGLTDNFSIGGGVFLPVAVFLTPKVGFKFNEKFHAGAGVIVGLFPGPTTVGILYGVATYGSNEHNITGGAGYGFIDNDFTQYPMITLSAMTRIGRRIALVTENWGIPLTDIDYNYTTGAESKKLNYMVLISYGIRIMNEKITFDIALINNKEIFDVFPIGIPYIDFVYKF